MLRRLAVVALLLVLSLAAAVFWVFHDDAPIPHGSALPEGVTILKDVYAAIYVIDLGPGEVALVDAGVDAEGAVLTEHLASRGLGPDAVRAIFLTHGHPDHIAAAPRFPNAKVYAMAGDIPMIHGEAAFRGPIPGLFGASDLGVRVTDPVTDGATVQIGPLTARVFAVPGHTPGSAAWVIRDVAFLGDAADADTSGELKPTRWLFAEDQEQGNASLVRLQERLRAEGIHLRHLAFGHTGPLAEGGALDRFVSDR